MYNEFYIVDKYLCKSNTSLTPLLRTNLLSLGTLRISKYL